MFLILFAILDTFNYNYHLAHHSNARPFPCEFPGCLNAYKTKADLNQHKKSHEKELGLTFFCFQCDLMFCSSTKLNVHKRECHSSKLSPGYNWCELCKKDFKNIRLHHDFVHLKLRPFACDACGKRFGRHGGVERHINSVHLNLKPFTCSICDKRFKEDGSLRK